MQVNISTRHGHLSPATQEKVSAKLEKLKRFKERMTSVEVTVDLERADEPKIELRVSIERSNDLVAHAEGDDLWGVLDGAIHKIEEQLRRHKAKKMDHRTTGRRGNDRTAWDAAESGSDEDDQETLDAVDEEDA